MKQTIYYLNREIIYDLSRKAVKYLNARVRQDGSLAVSVPRHSPNWQIEQFLLSHMPRLLRAMDAMVARQKEEPVVLKDGATLSLLGKPYTLRLVRGSLHGVREQGNELLLSLRHTESETRYAALLTAYLDDRAKHLLGEICREIYERYFVDCFLFPVIHYRRMVSRWGSCNKTRGVIVLNKRLLYAPRSSIEYVVLHELTHMLHPDHSARFYAAVAARMPDYRARAACLKQVDLRRADWL
ncbi:MAG: DUF45 domain-containing protein [Clostridia bacterium]|nr:DUF45 domain-containing protein [Clostridia bacterium]